MHDLIRAQLFNGCYVNFWNCGLQHAQSFEYFFWTSFASSESGDGQKDFASYRLNRLMLHFGLFQPNKNITKESYQQQQLHAIGAKLEVFKVIISWVLSMKEFGPI